MDIDYWSCRSLALLSVSTRYMKNKLPMFRIHEKTEKNQVILNCSLKQFLWVLKRCTSDCWYLNLDEAEISWIDHKKVLLASAEEEFDLFQFEMTWRARAWTSCSKLKSSPSFKTQFSNSPKLKIYHWYFWETLTWICQF